MTKAPHDGGRRRRAGRGGRRGERTVVPAAEFTSYYGKPVLNTPGWKPLNIGGYFFLGGLAGAGSLLAAGARLTGQPVTARAMKISSTVAVAGSVAALIHDLGRPARFANMLRVFKPTSPMSVGSWLLAAYGPLAGAAAVSDVTGVLPRAGDAATAGAALLGPAVATYTAVLAADTAVPAWHDGYRELPFVFAGSATAAAAGTALLAAPPREHRPVRYAALFGAGLEAVATRRMEQRLGMVAETYREGTAGVLMRCAKALTAAGALGAAVWGERGRGPAALAGAALLGGSVCTRLGVFHAGRAALADPKYTVVPQRERLRAREAARAAEREAAREQGDGAQEGRSGRGAPSGPSGGSAA
ncbi:polysulfide reductase [Streptomyces albus subsp. chlorinus]|uniref:NrfD/PsrC family molybdoenzyme membrane anchor subunit n=1 Tax=Streptomyces albus TaxID=1888 RepID=UPI001570464C|nr:NrfD/PsrC family molybdoenzyme membrane anchor subunit [Streptomyces albus]NSC24712.1 polysulfide reductase [Streptomyces albus subsp. chlorinus]